jgi:uncharacterized protein YjbI with pentapeptide repeats
MEEFYQEEFSLNSRSQLVKGVFEDCTFKQLDLSNQDLAEFKFIDCFFEDCNLSNCKLRDTSFQECEFKNAKLLGLQFEDCKAFNFGISVVGSLLSHSTFYKMDLKNCSFKDSDLEEVDFSEADLQGISLVNCDLKMVVFDQTNLQDCDLLASSNLQIDPENNQIKGAKIPSDQLVGLLAKYGIVVV